MKIKSVLSVILIVLLFSGARAEAPKIRVACVGNSITFGAVVVNREKNSYPQQLQYLLGENYDVKNFGVNGATLLRKGNYPYFKLPQYQEAKNFDPNIVLIKLGTNDSKLINRIYLNEYKSDYSALIDSFRMLPAKPRIILLLPLPAFNEADTVGITASVIRNRIIPAIRELAYEKGCEVINLYNLFLPFQQYLVTDKVHPSSIGAGIIARRVYETILLKGDQNFDIIHKLSIKGKETSYHGYPCTDFTFNGWACKIVRPKITANGKPWMWRARFWGHEPQTDIALLERGFHLVYCDVADFNGSNEGVERWNKFYSFMRKGGLSSKVVLEGMSRGGLIIYRWAAVNPEKVACIYADAPVLDLKSWPGGKGKGQGSLPDWNLVKKAYGFTTDQEAMNYKENPLDLASKIAKGGYPMLHVVGDADDVVPVAENTALFEKAVRESNGNIEVIHKPGVNHHPHSLENPTPIVDFILRSVNRKINFATLPAPGNEYRSGAGWKEGSDWWANYDEINKIVSEKKPTVLLIGNSITQGFGGSRNIVTWKPGREALNKALGSIAWESAGISGDRTQNVLWRVLNSNYEAANSKVIILTIGVNNSPDDTADEIAEGIRLCVKAINHKMPNTKVILFGTLPTGNDPFSPQRAKYVKIHQLLSSWKWNKQVTYRNVTEFIQPDGKLNPALVTADGIHLTQSGYELWSGIIANMTKDFLK